jgi:sec-independent protein translocase protein TatA
MTHSLLFVFGGAFGATEIVLIVIALLLLFGGRKIPELMRGLGTGIKEFKNASKSDEEKGNQAPPPPSSPQA